MERSIKSSRSRWTSGISEDTVIITFIKVHVCWVQPTKSNSADNDKANSKPTFNTNKSSDNSSNNNSSNVDSEDSDDENPKPTGQNMLKIAEKLENKSFYLRLNGIPNGADAVANDVCYHFKVLGQDALIKWPKKDIQEQDNFK